MVTYGLNEMEVFFTWFSDRLVNEKNLRDR